jgi:hypothetical protein
MNHGNLHPVCNVGFRMSAWSRLSAPHPCRSALLFVSFEPGWWVGGVPLNSRANCCLADVLVIKLELSYTKRYNGVPFGTYEIYLKDECMSDITLLQTIPPSTMQLTCFLLLFTFTTCFGRVWPTSGVLLPTTVSLCGIFHFVFHI